MKWAASYRGWGKVFVIKAADGDNILYAGNEQLLVKVGDRVNAGAEIARLGVSPQGGDARLYFSIQGPRGRFVDPEKYLFVQETRSGLRERLRRDAPKHERFPRR